MSDNDGRAISPETILHVHDLLYRAEVSDAEDDALQNRLVSMCLMAGTARRNKAQGGVDAPQDELIEPEDELVKEWDRSWETGATRRN